MSDISLSLDLFELSNIPPLLVKLAHRRCPNEPNLMIPQLSGAESAPPAHGESCHGPTLGKADKSNRTHRIVIGLFTKSKNVEVHELGMLL